MNIAKGIGTLAVVSELAIENIDWVGLIGIIILILGIIQEYLKNNATKKKDV